MQQPIFVKLVHTSVCPYFHPTEPYYTISVSYTHLDVYKRQVHLYMVLLAFCNNRVEITSSWPVVSKAVSSAKAANFVCSKFGMSLVNNTYKTGPRTLPCGTPAWTSFRSDYASSCLTLHSLLDKYEVRICTYCLGTVSYTHLDVYKRQHLHVFYFLTSDGKACVLKPIIYYTQDVTRRIEKGLSLIHI